MKSALALINNIHKKDRPKRNGYTYTYLYCAVTPGHSYIDARITSRRPTRSHQMSHGAEKPKRRGGNRTWAAGSKYQHYLVAVRPDFYHKAVQKCVIYLHLLVLRCNSGTEKPKRRGGNRTWATESKRQTLYHVAVKPASTPKVVEVFHVPIPATCNWFSYIK